MKVIVSITIAACLSLPVIAQYKRGMDLGVSASTGRNFYDKKYYDQPQLAPGWETYFKTNYLWSIGVWAESHLSPHFSTITDVRFMEEDVPINMLCQCSTMNEVLQIDEKHYWGVMGFGLRYYLNRTSKAKFFADVEAEVDWLIAAREKRYFMNEHQTKKLLDWDAIGYKQFVPGASVSLGAKWKRLTLSLGGVTNLARAMIRNPGTYDQVVYPIKTGFFGKGLFIKTSFTLIKLK